MKKIIFSAAIALAFLSSCGSNSSNTKSDSTAGVSNPASGTNVAAAKYQCPMKCEGNKTYDKPGKCPVCQMEMVKVEF